MISVVRNFLKSKAKKTYLFKTFVENVHLNQHVCDDNFENENYLNQHISNVHEVIKHLKSSEADNTFLRHIVIRLLCINDGYRILAIISHPYIYF